MGKFKASGGAEAAEIEAEVSFSQYDEATHGIPPKGPYRVRVRRIEGTLTKEKEDGTGGDPMIKAMVIIDEPKGSKKAKYNGYVMNLYRVATKDQAARMNQFLLALAGGPGAKAKALIKAFWDDQVVTEDADGFGMITKIGIMKFDPKGDGIILGCNTRSENSEQYGNKLSPTAFMPASALAEPVPADENEDADELEVADSEEVDERRDELAEMTLAKLKAVARGAGMKAVAMKNLDKNDIIEAILELEYPEPDEDADEDEEPDEDERREELGEMTKLQLRAIAKENGAKLAEYRPLDEAELIELILSQEEEEELPDEDEREAREAELGELTLAKLKTVAKGLNMKLAEYRNKDENELIELILDAEFEPTAGKKDDDPPF